MRSRLARRRHPAVLLGFTAALTACSGVGPRSVPTPGGQTLASLPAGAAGGIEVRRFDAGPELTLVSRDGDPAPAIVATVTTDLGSVATTALAAVVESRLRAAGFDLDTRADRSAFRARLVLPDASRFPALFTALAAAFARPIAPGSPELALAAQRLDALKRNPLDAAELTPIAACTGALGIAPGDPVADVATPAGAHDAEMWRQAALQVGRTSIAVVGPAAVCAAAADALAKTHGWPLGGTAAADAWPASDTVGAYTSPALDRHLARVTVAVRAADPRAAAAAAERLGAPDSPLSARLRALAQPWRVLEVSGVARPRGGCVSVVVETSPHPPGLSIEASAALAGSLVREEMLAELAVPVTPSIASRQILMAADPREAASRASWWALAGAATGTQNRWAFALGLPPSWLAPPHAGPASTPPGTHVAPSAEASLVRFQAELDRAARTLGAAVTEKRVAIERGQGELWLLLASPCGVAEESAQDAGLSALATLTAIEARRAEDNVEVEPWITADGIGVIAHAPSGDERESPARLAHRVADAAARTLAAASLTPEATLAARSAILDLLERTDGREGAVFSVLAAAIAPDHPSWVEPFGVWSHVASSALEGIRVRSLALASGPMRLAVSANADADQAKAAGIAVDRWFSPTVGPRTCRPTATSAPRPGRYETQTPNDARLAQALIGAPMAASSGSVLAEITALALDGDAGLLAGALAHAAAGATARIVGGSRAPALLIDVRAPAGGVASAVADVKLLLARLPQAASEGDLARAFTALERRDRDGRADPRRRVIDLWSGRKPAAAAKPSLAAWRAFLGDALKDASLVVVEPKSD